MIHLLFPRATCPSRSLEIQERFRQHVEAAAAKLCPGQEVRVSWGRTEFIPVGLGPYVSPGVGCPAAAVILQTREALGLSVEAAARLVQVTVQYWAHWEMGTFPMHPALWEAFVEYATAPKPAVVGGEALALRKRAGLSQSQAATVLGITVQTWANWEHGRAKMPQHRKDLFILKTGVTPC